MRVCTCPGGLFVLGGQSPTSRSVTLVGNEGFAGCATRCGDGIKGGNEECDDGNTDSDDGCSDVCTKEPGYDCPEEGILCCMALPMDIDMVLVPLKCWNGFWIPENGFDPNAARK